MAFRGMDALEDNKDDVGGTDLGWFLDDDCDLDEAGDYIVIM